MPNLILVGVDGSASSRKAAQVAAELASSMGATLHVMTAVSGLSRAEPKDYAEDFDSLSVGEQASLVASEVAHSVSGVVPVVQHSQWPGSPVEGLLALAEDLGADVIVVGNRRVQGIGRVLGSVATSVVHQAPCDVYVVKTV
jgi:nucleotide-binding universal stress UspA family protein